MPPKIPRSKKSRPSKPLRMYMSPQGTMSPRAPPTNTKGRIPFSPEAINADRNARLSMSAAPILLFLLALCTNYVCHYTSVCNPIFADPSSLLSKLWIVLAVLLMGVVACAPAAYFIWKRSKLFTRDQELHKRI